MKCAKIKFLVVCMFTLLTVTMLSISCKVEPAAVKEWTVTIDPNNMDLGGTLKVTVKDGEKATLPSDIKPPADYEIPYYSTVKDDYSKVYDFANTAVTSDITVYPHYRFASAKAYKNIEGTWLDVSDGATVTNRFIKKVSADNSLNGNCFAREGFSDNLDLSLDTNKNILTALRNLPVLSLSANPIGQNASNQTIDGRDISLYCSLANPLQLAYQDSYSNALKITGTKFFENYLLDNVSMTYDTSSIIITTYNNGDTTLGKNSLLKFKKLN